MNRAAMHRAMIEVDELLGRRGGAQRATTRFQELVPFLPRSRDPLRQPTIYYPGLRNRPIWNARRFPWYERVRRAAAYMRAEYEGLRRAKRFAVIFPGPEQEGYWAAAWLWLYGKNVAANVARCPKTMAALRGISRAGWGGFSVMKPGARVAPHCGATNAKLRVHVPLVVPEGCRMRVGREMVHWKEGEPVVFDDSYEHEVWTTEGEPRAIFMFDVMHPDLSPDEAKRMDRLDLFFAKPYVQKLKNDGIGKTMPWLYPQNRT